jgi:diacylglycerol O-acyltransferase
VLAAHAIVHPPGKERRLSHPSARRSVARGHGQRLSAIDASFLALESPRAHMHVGWSAICSPPAGGERPTIAALRARAASRMAALPRCRQRLLLAPLGLGEPRWVDDARFDLAVHVVALSEADDAVGPARFEELRDALLSEPLDRSRPLWQIAFVPRLHDGRLAILGRVHHAMADGTAALQVATLVLDADGEEEEAGSPESWSAEPAPGATSRALDPLLHGAERTTRAARDVARAAVRPRSAARSTIRDAGRIGRALAEDLLPRGPGCRLNARLGPRRTLVGHRAALADLRSVTTGRAATLNDAGLAVVAGALRALALGRGEPADPLKAMIPVDVRRRHERGALGNHVSFVAIWLPLQLASPAARLEAVRGQTARSKHAGRHDGSLALLSAVELLPGALRGVLLRAGASSRAFNLTVSSVRGPSGVLSVLGAPMDEIYPVIPIVEQHTLSIGMLRYRDHLHFGVYADPDALPEVARLPHLLAREVRALRGSVKPVPPLQPEPGLAYGARSGWHAAGRLAG